MKVKSKTVKKKKTVKKVKGRYFKADGEPFILFSTSNFYIFSLSRKSLNAI